MNIVIVGSGKVGFTVAEELSQEGHDITIIDIDPLVLRRTEEALDIITLAGNGASYQVQREAGVARADLMIAATSFDEMNMICCLVARKLGAGHTIARIRNPEYRQQMLLLKDELGLSMVVNPEQATAEEISRLITFPFAISTSIFAKGRVSIVEMRIAADSPLVGETIAQIHQKHTVNILICAVERNGKCYIPRGDFVLQAEDRIHVSGDQKKIAVFLRSIDVRYFKVKRVMIIGGGRIAYYLAKIIEANGIDIRIIEKNLERCEFLSNELDCLIIQGDGTDPQLLLEEGLNETDAFIALTDIDEENMVTSLFAAKNGVSKVIAKINRENYFDLIQQAGIDSLVSPKYITAYQILQYVRALENASASKVRALYRIVDDQAEIVEFLAGEDTLHLKEKLMEIKIRQNTIIGAIVRNGKLIIPHGQDCILENDTVIAITTHKNFSDINDIFDHE